MSTQTYAVSVTVIAMNTPTIPTIRWCAASDNNFSSSSNPNFSILLIMIKGFLNYFWAQKIFKII